MDDGQVPRLGPPFGFRKYSVDGRRHARLGAGREAPHRDNARRQRDHETGNLDHRADEAAYLARVAERRAGAVACDRRDHASERNERRCHEQD
jgi:hypothetical protein